MARNSNKADDSMMDKVKRALGFASHEDYYRQEFDSRRASGASGGTSSDASWDTARPAYELGHQAGTDERYANRSFDEAESDLRSQWERTQSAGSWDSHRDYARGAYDYARDQRLTLSEEQLSVGKRQVQSGEVSLRKTVETERVKQSVPLSHEEVTIERRPLSADAAADLEIGEQTISVPLMAEEAVVEKRVVPTEEVVVRKQAVSEDRTVEADVRKERLVTEGLDAQQKTRLDADRESR
jgi:uncharacterized protein (TIGR02271 family)